MNTELEDQILLKMCIFDDLAHHFTLEQQKYNMLNLLNKSLTTLFGGTKQDKDIKASTPIVQQINNEFAKLDAISNDELRNKTIEFKSRINKYVEEFDQNISELKLKAQNEEDTLEKEKILNQADELAKEKDKHIEDILMQILPEAFAVVKETARRFTNNAEITATANDLDRELAVTKPHISISGDQVTYQN
ncbi:MAG: hypothetical protein ACOVP5_08650, partial [Chitinophagales bacterium]